MANQISPLGFPVTKDTAERVFCGLKNNWWKQLYDGKFHAFGPKVFDEGLHGSQTEPGFYESAHKAFNFAKLHLKEKLSVEFYCNLHKEACSHFKGSKNNTNMEAWEAGHFRDNSFSCRFKIGDMLTVGGINDERKKKLIAEFVEARQYFGDKVVKKLKERLAMDKSMKGFCENFSITPEEVQEIDNLVQNKFKTLQETLNSIKLDSILTSAVPGISLNGALLYLAYAYLTPVSFEKVIAHLFEAFNQNLAKIDKEIVACEHDKIDGLAEKKLVLIDDLYETLEFFHPFPDGQGRTDLLLLAKLLSENGFTPTILDEPYMSSYSSRDEWVAYQKVGMQKWQEEEKRTNS